MFVFFFHVKKLKRNIFFSPRYFTAVAEKKNPADGALSFPFSSIGLTRYI